MHKLYAITIMTTILSTNTISATDTIYITKSFYENRVLDKKSNKSFKMPKEIRNINKDSKRKNKKSNKKKNKYVKDIVA